MATVMITGGTGMIGTALSALLADNGYNVIILSRNPLETAARHNYLERQSPFRHNGRVYYSRWDIDNPHLDSSALAEADYIIHLAGAGVADKRWTSARKKEILESRTKSSSLLVKAMKDHTNKVKAVISASAIGWYGPDKGRPFMEDDPPAGDFLGQTCLEWEKSIEPVEAMGKRLVKLRLGIVFSNEGGALKEFRKPLRTGVAAILGKGDQVISWVHIEDICRAFMFALEDKNLAGTYNVVSPYPVNNKQLTLTLAWHITNKRHFMVHVPEFALKIALGEMSTEVLKSATVSSDKLQKAGFTFNFPTLESAINNLYP